MGRDLIVYLQRYLNRPTWIVSKNIIPRIELTRIELTVQNPD